MSLFEEVVTAGDVTIKLRRVNPKKVEFITSVLTIKFLQQYPEMEAAAIQSTDPGLAMPSDLGNRLILAFSFNPLNTLASFVSLFLHLVEIDGNGFIWPKATDPIEKLDFAFQWFMDNYELIWPPVEKALDLLDVPNGVEGKPEEALTPEEKKDPLSESAA